MMGVTDSVCWLGRADSEFADALLEPLIAATLSGWMQATAHYQPPGWLCACHCPPLRDSRSLAVWGGGPIIRHS